jgi:hypothetical protein
MGVFEMEMIVKRMKMKLMDDFKEWVELKKWN